MELLLLIYNNLYNFQRNIKLILQPAFKDFFAFVNKSYFNAFIEISSEIKIPLNPIFF